MRGPYREVSTKPPLRDTLHLLADLLADALEARSNRVDSFGDERNGPPRPAAPARRRAPRMPPVVTAKLDVTPQNRERARQALLRRGVVVRREEECP